MEFKDNFSEHHLLFAQPVEFILYKTNIFNPTTTFVMDLPTYKTLYFNQGFKQFLGMINTPIEDLQKQFDSLIQFNTLYELFMQLVKLDNDAAHKYVQTFIDGLIILKVPITFDCSGFYINQAWVSEKLFNRFCNIILVSTALKKQSDIIDDPELAAYQAKIDRIKRQGRQVTGDGVTEERNLHKMFIILTYEFGYKPEEILNMTQYTINLILSYTNGSINYKLSLIAAGNGNTKKIKFIAEKGK